VRSDEVGSRDDYLQTRKCQNNENIHGNTPKASA
jgi:hypothetical protein